MERIRAHVFISGRVQGVFFRYNTRREALKRGLKGWVRNLFDGRVEAVFEGDRKTVEDMLERCRIGPPHARVDRVDVKWEDYRGECKDFYVKYTSN